MKYLQPGGFSVCTPGTQEYRDNWDAIFDKKPDSEEAPPVSECNDPKCNICESIRTNKYDPTPLEMWTRSTEDAKQHVLAELAALDEREPLALGSIQRRIREWAEHNFPLKATDEHRRVAKEFLERLGPVWSKDIENLAYLLASREHRSHRMLLGACEELGELCHAHLKNEQGIRGTPEKWREAKKDAIGDTIVYLLDYCNKEGLDVEECLQMALDEIATRDWVKYPLNGKTA